MDNSLQEQYIQKKLLYKFDKKLDLTQTQYSKQVFPSNENPPKITRQELFDQISNLEFINFKYKTALLSSNKDLNRNEEQILRHDSMIVTMREEIKTFQDELQQAAIIKQNKIKFNQAGTELMKFDKQNVIDQKLETVKTEIKELDEKYRQDMKKYELREKYLKASLSSLQMFLRDFETSKLPEREMIPFTNEKDMEDDGLIE